MYIDDVKVVNNIGVGWNGNYSMDAADHQQCVEWYM